MKHMMMSSESCMITINRGIGREMAIGVMVDSFLSATTMSTWIPTRTANLVRQGAVSVLMRVLALPAMTTTH